ncbi:MAG: type I-F CRISPR-associated helicase Cas3f [Gammaproteobacteria bacterium]|nr:type I-F CRISPR-associated helicase Cas3f [Gammaproteobacteria bacterium]
MMVTFVSQCEKNSLKKTRRVLDAFANRIGDNTWQTVITNDGLNTVKKMLRQTASKNTAVSCHWIRSRSRSQFLWVVGNKDKFDEQGVVPVNSTQHDKNKMYDEEAWNFLPIIQSLVVFSALLHDFGKLTSLFQNKLKGLSETQSDPIRHEWISLLFFYAIVEGKSDKQWLSSLISDEIHKDIKKLKIKNIDKPLANLPPVASLVAWLIVSHHKLPSFDKGKEKAVDFYGVLNLITRKWGYENKHDTAFNDWFEFTELPSKSIEWQEQVKSYAIKLRDNIEQVHLLVKNNNFRPILVYSRLCLTLGDHFYSSQPKDKDWYSSLNLFANTDHQHHLKQKLDEHLVGVAKQTLLNVKKLPQFEGIYNQAIRVINNKKINEKSEGHFKWQDSAVKEIRKWKRNGNDLDKNHYGFFAVNMASTGKGKTFANAKIMQALSSDENSLRYILALGLRTLTLQTGDEYRNKIGLTNNELAVLIGSRAILNLHNKENTTGSDSIEALLDNEVSFSKDFPEQGLDTVLLNPKDRSFLYAPVLTCTIDHIIQATEVTRGGRYILPTLRLMSSDLVIDEIDDFDDTDLIAIGRLIHLAGMLGRKVMISSATIPPDLAEGYFNTYQSGWNIFAKMRGKQIGIGCAWIDEFESITKVKTISDVKAYSKLHNKFVSDRIGMLIQQPVKRKANIEKCSTNVDEYFDAIKNAIINKHRHHNFIDPKTKKTISIGVVRVANVDPCIKLTKYLLTSNFLNDKDVAIKTMAYHSRQVLLMRHEQEKYLDKILKRNNGEEHIFQDKVIREHIDNSSAQNIIFVLVATPVEEVGRDHDFDWAVIEPSSYRSFIQLAGRVLRHREKEIAEPNIAIMKYNYKALKTKGDEIAFRWPGYQKTMDDISSYDLEKIVNTRELCKKLDATNRIQRTNNIELANLEHKLIHELLTNYNVKGPETMQGWLENGWWLTGVPQKFVRFRNRQCSDLTLFFTMDDGFVEKNNKGKAVPVAKDNITIERLENEAMQNLWFKRDYKILLSEQAKEDDLEKTALIYGEINLPLYNKPLTTQQFTYIEQLGLARK